MNHHSPMILGCWGSEYKKAHIGATVQAGQGTPVLFGESTRCYRSTQMMRIFERRVLHCWVHFCLREVILSLPCRMLSVPEQRCSQLQQEVFSEFSVSQARISEQQCCFEGRLPPRHTIVEGRLSSTRAGQEQRGNISVLFLHAVLQRLVPTIRVVLRTVAVPQVPECP